VLLALSLQGCGYNDGPPGSKPLQQNIVSLDPQQWYVLYSAGLSSHPSTDPNGAWSFEFPKASSGGHVNYLETPFQANVTLHNITAAFRVISNDPQYFVVDPSDHLPATCRLMIEQQNDDLRDPNGRWWANASIYNLGSQDNQIVSYTIPLTSDQWTNVDGERDATALANAVSNIGWVGITFGGQYFAGHGVAIGGGSAKFVLISYDVD
jgi:hypothetical protein